MASHPAGSTLLVISILTLALLWRLLGISDTEVWRDEAITLIHARASWWTLLTQLAWVEDTPPLVFLLFKAWSLLFTSEWSLRLFPVLIGVATVGVLMRLAANIHPRAWWPVGLLAAFSHVPVHFSQELRIYSLLGLVTVLCLWAAERANRSDQANRWMIALAGLGALAAHCHAVGIFVYPMTLVYWLVMSGWQKGFQRAFLAGPVVWLVLASPMIWFNFHWAGSHAASGDWWIPMLDRHFAQRNLERFFGLTAVDSWMRTQSLGIAQWIAFGVERLLMLAPVLLVMAALCDRSLRRSALALALAAVSYLAMMMVASLQTVPTALVRTLLPAWYPILLLIGIGGAASLPRTVRRLPSVIGIVLAIIWAGTWVWNVYAGPPRRPMADEVFAYVRQRLGPNDLVFSSPGWYQDRTVYQLGDLLSADRLFNAGAPVYEGAPLRHSLIPAAADPDWLARFEAATERQRAAVGTDYRVWVFQFGWFGRVWIPDEIDSMLTQRHRRVTTLAPRENWAAIVACYVPVELPGAHPAEADSDSSPMP